MRSFVSGIILVLVIIGVAVAVLPSFGVVDTSAQSSDGARRITPADLRELIKKNQAILVDVRSTEAYRAGHIKGALSIPYSEIASRAGELPKDKLIATYCS
jgi:3-mercaptopyruvate sulfurtransferase SseA